MGSNPPTFPTKQRPTKPSMRLSGAKDLSTYVMQGGQPESAGASNFGAMCEIMLAQAWTHIRCPRCQARKRRRKRLQLIAEAGLEVPERCDAKRRVYAVLGQGGVDTYDAEILVLWLDLLEDMGCARCHGTGWVEARITDTMRNNPRITAFPTGSSKHGKPPPTVAESDRETDELERVGRVGNLLVRLRAADPSAAEALEIHRAPGGAGLHRLWHLTKSGADLLDTRTRVEQQEPERVFFYAQVRRRKQGYTDRVRDAYCAGADREALRLLERAAKLWNELVDDARAVRDGRKARAIERDARGALPRGLP